MNSQIGFRTGKDSNTEGSVMEIRPVAAITDATSANMVAAPSPSRISDYAYRIAALTAWIALLASIW